MLYSDADQVPTVFTLMFVSHLSVGMVRVVFVVRDTIIHVMIGTTVNSSGKDIVSVVQT